MRRHPAEPANTSSHGKLLQGLHGVVIGVGVQYLDGGGELIARLGVPTPQAQRTSGDGLSPGSGPGLAALQVMVTGPARVLDRSGIAGVGDGGFRGTFPQPANILLSVRGVPALGALLAEFGGGGIAAGGTGGGTGPLGALGGPDQRSYGLVSDLFRCRDRRVWR